MTWFCDQEDFDPASCFVFCLIYQYLNSTKCFKDCFIFIVHNAAPSNTRFDNVATSNTILKETVSELLSLDLI